MLDFITQSVFAPKKRPVKAFIIIADNLTRRKMLSKDTEVYQKALGYVQMLKLEGKPDEDAVVELKRMYQLTEEEASDILNTFKTEKKEIYTAQIWINIKSALGPLIYCAIIAVIYFALASVGGTIKSINGIYALLFVFAGLCVLGVILRLLRERIEATSLVKFVRTSKAYQRYRGYVTKKTVRPFIALVCFVPLYFHFTSNSASDTTHWTQINELVLTEDCKEIVINGKTKTRYYLFTTEQTSKAFKWFQNDHYYQFAKGISSPDKYFHARDTVSIWVNKKELIYESSFFDQCNEVYNVAKKGEPPVLDLIGRDRAASQQNKKTMLVLAVLLFFIIIVSRYENKKPAKFQL